MIGIRGAVTAKENTAEAIRAAARMLVSAVMTANRVEKEEVVDILFTATDDLTAAYPAAAARELGLTEAGLMCMAEMPMDGSLRRCIRLLMHVARDGKQSDAIPIYLGGAAILRPELACYAVAIDGPNLAGKSTAARLLAERLGVVYVDTGAMYRAVALYNHRQGTDLQAQEAVLASLPAIDIAPSFSPDGKLTWLLNGQDVTEALYAPEIAEGASVVARYAAVREKLIYLQQRIALTRRVVMDGRDIGSHVLPWAPLKIYLDARLDVRVAREIAKRRQKGLPCDEEAVRREVETRDIRDRTRAVSPLVRAEDAVYIDCSDMTPEEVAARMEEYVCCTGLPNM